MQRLASAHKRPIILVPTMGALHDGHVTLLRKGCKQKGGGGLLVASVFVNPTQFGPAEDFARYPRPHEEDARLCREAGVDILFMPSVRSMYAEDHSTYVEEDSLSQGLCGESRPGHFRGVCTVVLKLFMIVRPTIAIFGRKDYQQLAVIRRMTRDLNLAVKIRGIETVRDSDGVALSSRNKYLSPEERNRAPLLRRVLLEIGLDLKRGRSPAAAVALGKKRIESDGAFRVDYLRVVDADTLAPLKTVKRRMVVVAAVYLGKTRLIDNLSVTL